MDNNNLYGQDNSGSDNGQYSQSQQQPVNLTKTEPQPQPEQSYQQQEYQQQQPYQQQEYQQQQGYQQQGYQQQEYQQQPYQQQGYQQQPYQQPYQQQPYQQPYQQQGYQQPAYESGSTLEPPVSVGDWMVTALIMCIPCVNIIMMFVWAFGNNTNKSKSNYFKASLIWLAIILAIYLVIIIIFGASLLAVLGDF